MADHDREAARMREAAETALSQLDWCIRYFERERRPQIAHVLARNVRHIRRDLA